MFDINPRTLNQAPAVVRFVEQASVPSGLDAMLGRAANYPLAAKSIEAAQAAVSRNIKKVGDLFKDETRLPPQKHSAARDIGKQTIGVLVASKNDILEKANALTAQADGEVSAAFAPNRDRAGIESEIRALIRETAKKETGIADIRKMMRDDFEFASVISHSPALLLGIQKDVHKNMQFDAIEKHLPDTWKRCVAANDLLELSPKFEKVIGNIRSLHNDDIADRMATRVSTDD